MFSTQKFCFLQAKYQWNLQNETKNAKQYLNGTISELCTDDKKSKYFSYSNNIFKSAKNFNEKLYKKEINVQNCQC